MFLFPGILLFELIVSCRSDSRLEFEFLYDFWAIVCIEVTLSFMISLLILLIPNESKYCSCGDFLKLSCFWLFLSIVDARCVADGINIMGCVVILLLFE